MSWRVWRTNYSATVVEVADHEDYASYCKQLPRALGPDQIAELVVPQVTLTLEPDATGYMSRRGEAVGGSGYQLDCQSQNPAMLWDTVPEVDLPGVDIIRVAGSSFRPHALQDSAFEPGNRLRLLPEPENKHDRDAIAIWDAGLRLQAGYVPAKLAPVIGRRLREGRVRVVRSIWQWRDLDTGARIGLHVLVSATDRLTIRRLPTTVRRLEYEEPIDCPELEW